MFLRGQMHFLYQNVCLESLGYTLPETVVTSTDLEHRLQPLYERLRLPQGRLELMTGIGERRFWPGGTAVSDISVGSCRAALQAADVDPAQIGLLVHGSVCRDHLEPATACRVHHLTGLVPNCQVYDVSNACLGILNGLIQAANMIELGQTTHALVVGSENGRGLMESTIAELNRNQRLTRKTIKNSIASLTIGSASCAVLLAHRTVSHSQAGLIGGVASANTRFHELCRSLGDQAGGGMSPLMDTDSETLMLHGIETGRITFEQFLERLQWHREEVAQTVCHQVGATHRKLMLESIGLDVANDFVTFPWLGNTGSAALPVTLARAFEQQPLAAGQRLALLGIGSGINCLILGIETGNVPCLGRECDDVAELRPAARLAGQSR